MLFSIVKNKPRLDVLMEESVFSIVLSGVYSEELAGSLTFHFTAFSTVEDFYREDGLFL